MMNGVWLYSLDKSSPLQLAADPSPARPRYKESESRWGRRAALSVLCINTAPATRSACRTRGPGDFTAALQHQWWSWEKTERLVRFRVAQQLNRSSSIFSILSCQRRKDYFSLVRIKVSGLQYRNECQEYKLMLLWSNSRSGRSNCTLQIE